MKVLVKTIVFVIAAVLMVPAVLACRLNQLAMGEVRGFVGWSQLVSLIPGELGISLRQAFYHFILPQAARNACISFGTVFSHPSAELGDFVYVGVGCMIGDVTLSRDVLVGSHVSIINGNKQHDTTRVDLPLREQPGIFPRIVIGQDTWIGERSVVMANIGEHCLVGAGSVVTREVADFDIVAGNPARVIGSRRQADV